MKLEQRVAILEQKSRPARRWLRSPITPPSDGALNLEQRVAVLERTSRRYRNLFLLTALVAAALVTWGQAKPVPAVIEAHSFVVLDQESGAPLAKLGQKATGGTLDLLDRNGSYVVYLDVEGSGKGRLMLCTPGGAMRRDCTTSVSP